MDYGGAAVTAGVNAGGVASHVGHEGYYQGGNGGNGGGAAAAVPLSRRRWRRRLRHEFSWYHGDFSIGNGGNGGFGGGGGGGSWIGDGGNGGFGGGGGCFGYGYGDNPANGGFGGGGGCVGSGGTDGGNGGNGGWGSVGGGGGGGAALGPAIFVNQGSLYLFNSGASGSTATPGSGGAGILTILLPLVDLARPFRPRSLTTRQCQLFGDERRYRRAFSGNEPSDSYSVQIALTAPSQVTAGVEPNSLTVTAKDSNHNLIAGYQARSI